MVNLFFFAAIISIFWKFVTLFLIGISLLVLNSIIDVGESVSFLRPIELNTKNKLTAPPQFRFCFCCYHHPIFWKFVTLFLMGKKSKFFFFTVRGSAKEGGKERKKGEVGYSHKRFFILAQFSTKNTGGSVSLLVLNSIIDVEESVSFLRYR